MINDHHVGFLHRPFHPRHELINIKQLRRGQGEQ
jgi:hypothetical protein